MKQLAGMICLFVTYFFVCGVCSAKPVDSAPPLWDGIMIDGEANITEGQHLGIINHHLTCGTPTATLGELDGLWAPPWVSHDFGWQLRVEEEFVPTDSYRWFPMKIESCGNLGDLAISTELFLVAHRRAEIFMVTVANNGDSPRRVKIEILPKKCTLDWSDRWEFIPERSTTPVTVDSVGATLWFRQGDHAVGLCALSPNGFWNAETMTGTATLEIPPQGAASLQWVVAIGSEPDVARDLADISTDPESFRQNSETFYTEELKEIFRRLPTLESDNESFVRLYRRSLLHFFLNRWNVEEFVLNPYYGTGSVRGGCVGNYLWNFGEPWEILPWFDPDADAAHIKQFLGLNLTKHFAFHPVTGEPFGPWYMVNQEKIIGLIYYYVKQTGHLEFLDEEVAGKTIFEHLLEQAIAHDDLSQPVALIDYGPSNSHLELRKRSNAYNHIMPDLNGRRYANYVMVAALAAEYGRPQPVLLERAEGVKKLLKEKLWNRTTRWFDFINDRGEPETRYTIQMFKMINSPVLDDELLAGLISHLNETEFLGPHGIHSLAKPDPEYDPADVDNGGPGACTSFAPRIAELFYKSGRANIGADIFRRLLWLGERMPYWGDSVYADRIDYRHDTPLQCVFDGTAIAQAILFGMFGLEIHFNGDIFVHPQRPDFVETMALRGVKLRRQQFDVEVSRDGFSVRLQNLASESAEAVFAKPNETVVIRNGAASSLSDRPPTDNGFFVF